MSFQLSSEQWRRSLSTDCRIRNGPDVRKSFSECDGWSGQLYSVCMFAKQVYRSHLIRVSILSTVYGARFTLKCAGPLISYIVITSIERPSRNDQRKFYCFMSVQAPRHRTAIHSQCCSTRIATISMHSLYATACA